MKVAKTLMVVGLPLAAIVLMGGAENAAKVYIRTDPPGAEVWDVPEKSQTEKLGKKTPNLFPLSQGKHTLMLRLEGYEDAVIEVNVTGSGIIKPDVVKLVKKAGAAPAVTPGTVKPALPATPAASTQVDILFAEDGWSVLVDGKEVKDVTGQPAETPCTLDIPLGRHEISIKKPGFDVISQKATITAQTASIEIKKPAPAQFRNRIVIWNTNNLKGGQFGTKAVNIILSLKGAQVFRKNNAIMEWAQEKEIPYTLELPVNAKFDKIRVEFVSWIDRGAAISEIEVYLNGRNVALGKKATTSANWHEKAFLESHLSLTDGVTIPSFNKQAAEYWINPMGSKGWVEIEF